MKLDPAEAVIADIYAYDDGVSYEGPTWPSADGVAVIICNDCGEIDIDGRWAEKNTVYSTFGDPDTCTEMDRCNTCKCYGFLLVGI